VADESAGATPRRGGGWRPFQIYALALLTLVTTFNYFDRSILGILQEPIKAEMRLSDWQLGLLSGPAFALFYSFVGVPVARIAERVHRGKLLAIALAIWSGMTAVCGLAQNYVHLVLGRMGVGMGEGACSPSAHSLLSEYFAPRQRALAMSVLSTSIPIAGFTAPLIAGAIAQDHGWRIAFIVCGLPGVAVGLLLWLTLKDPRTSEAAAPGAPARPTFLADIKWLATTPAFVFLFLGSAFMGMALGGTNVFSASYLLREFGLTLKTAGIVMALGLGVAGLLGTFIGGYMADRFAGDRGRAYVLVPGIGAGLAAVFFLIAFTRESWPVAAAFLIIANVCTDLKNGPNYAVVQNLVPPHMRATGSAVLLFGVTVVGTASGPVIVGGLSDIFAAADFPSAQGTFASGCPGGRAAAGAAPETAAACTAASAAGIKAGLMIASSIYVLAMGCFFLSARTIRLRLDD